MSATFQRSVGTESGFRLARSLVQNSVNHGNGTLSNSTIHNKSFSLCDKIILIDTDFINISWNRMWMTTGELLVVYLLSYGVKSLE